MTEERRKSKPLPEKQFELREATFSKVLKNENVATVHRFGLIAVFYLALSNALNDIYNGGTSKFGFKLIRLGFADMDRTLLLWLSIFSTHILVYFGWHIWRIFRPKNSHSWDIIWICILLFYLFGCFHYTVMLMLELRTPIISRAIILAESTRLLMKSYAFVRSNCYEYLTNKSFEVPKISKFVYFSFAPTLIYKAEYPRWPTRNWGTIGKYVLEIALTIYTLSLLEETYLIRPLQTFGKQPFTNSEIFVIIIDKIVPCFIAWILFARIILHSFQCIFAELLQFGDRQFHKDWWNSKCLSEFHLTWNVVVQDWLFYYVYKDIYEYVSPKNKLASRTAVYVLSMVLHEVLLMYAVGITCPVYIVFMTVSLVLTFSKTTDAIVNKFTLFNIVLGESLLLIVPHLEYFAKHNCPKPTDAILYVPKLYTCFK